MALADTIGVVFQIVDDFKNLSSTTYTMSKGVFAEDLTEGKFSFPIIHAIRSDTSNMVLMNILKQKTDDENVKRYAVAYMERTGSFAYTRNFLNQLTSFALGLVDALEGVHGDDDGKGAVNERRQGLGDGIRQILAGMRVDEPCKNPIPLSEKETPLSKKETALGERGTPLSGEDGPPSEKEETPLSKKTPLSEETSSSDYALRDSTIQARACHNGPEQLASKVIDTFVRPAVAIKDEVIKLTPADQLITQRFHIPIVLCFKLESSAHPKQILSDLVAGLSHTLVDIPFLAGRIVPEEGDNGRVQIVVGSDAGVTFNYYDLRPLGTETSVCTYDELELAHFIPSKLDPLLPKSAPNKRMADTDEPVLYLDACFIAGGLVLAMYIHHSAVDASAMSRFGRIFSSHTKAAAAGWKLAPVRLAPEALDRSPLFDNPVDFAIEDTMAFRVLDPSIFKSNSEKGTCAETQFDDGTIYRERLAASVPSINPSKPVPAWWYFSAEKLRDLKELALSTASTDSWVSTSDALMALIWRRWIVYRCLLEKGVEASTLWTPINFRSRLGLHPDYMGNAVYMVDVDSPTSELYSIQPDALYRPSSRIRNVIRSVDASKVRRALATLDSMDPRSFMYNFDMSGRDLCITSMANYEWYSHDWGCDLGKITRMRYKFTFAGVDGTAMVNPKFIDGGLEVATLCDIEVVERLRVDEEFMRFAEFRGY